MGVALVAAVVAGTAAVLGLSAGWAARPNPTGAAVLAIGALWIPQSLIWAAFYRRH